MAGASIEITLDDAGLVLALGRLVQLGRDTRPLMAAIGTGLVENVQTRIERERTPDGQPFKPLLPAYALIKRGPGILRGAGMRGGLQGSITYEADPLSVTVGTNKVYGAIHQFGGVIRPVAAQALAFFLGAPGGSGPRGGKRAAGRVLVLAKKVTIPARPYLGFSEADRASVLEATEALLGRLLRP